MTPIKAILTDIEGTLSAIHFVRQVLFPYAAQRLPEFIAKQGQQPAVQELLTQAATLAQVSAQEIPAIVNALLHWLATDQKITPLKTLQGMIWEQGYREGRYQAPLYADAAACLADWHQRGIPLAVYSSGSVQAQKLFFEIKDVDNKYTAPALYYYSHIAYLNKNYETAQKGFLKLSDNPNFGPLVPYYIAQIYYLQGKYDEVINYAPALLDSANIKRQPEIAHLLGDAYFKKSKYTEALPYFEKYQKSFKFIIQ